MWVRAQSLGKFIDITAAAVRQKDGKYYLLGRPSVVTKETKPIKLGCYSCPQTAKEELQKIEIGLQSRKGYHYVS